MMNSINLLIYYNIVIKIIFKKDSHIDNNQRFEFINIIIY